MTVMNKEGEKLQKFQFLIDLTKTTEDIVKLDEEIGLLLQSLYQMGGDKFEEALRMYVRIRVSMEISKYLQSNKITGRDEIKAFLSSAYRTICALPILKLTLAFEPSELVISDLSRWARAKLGEGILLDLTLDRTLVGGALIVYQGKFYDFSLRKKLSEIFKKGDLTL